MKFARSIRPRAPWGEGERRPWFVERAPADRQGSAGPNGLDILEPVEILGAAALTPAWLSLGEYIGLSVCLRMPKHLGEMALIIFRNQLFDIMALPPKQIGNGARNA
jgi:hypothetical protein